jgi:hypothetical protein
MSLSILSKEIISIDSIFKNISLAALKGKLFYAVNDNSLKANDQIENLNIRKYFGNGEDDYDFLLMEIYNQDKIVNFLSKRIINKEIYYCVAGTDNAPSRLCYDFSLSYLRLSPDHLISIYEHVFSLYEIEAIEKKGIYTDTWYYDFKKIDASENSI